MNVLGGNVLVTGGAGFLARGLYRRARRENWDAAFTCYSRHEEAQDALRRRFPEVRSVVGDVRDVERLTSAMVGHDAVIHAGALKRIPECELSAYETVQTNIMGSLSVLRAAGRALVRQVVGISTDKAASPVNIYGMSKAVMERLFAEASTDRTIFTCVRYGNVVGSTGSGIPLFPQQLADLGRVRVTNPAMTRFWLGIDEAIDLVLLALTKAQPGSVVVPLARAMTVLDVARAATRDDVEVEVIGQRPGEKEHELLLHYEESVRARKHKDWFELLPPGAKGGADAFTIASHSPHRRMSVTEMRWLIADAAEV